MLRVKDVFGKKNCRLEPATTKTGCFNTHMLHGTGIFTYIYHKNQLNVGKYTIHGSYGMYGIFTYT